MLFVQTDGRRSPALGHPRAGLAQRLTSQILDSVFASKDADALPKNLKDLEDGSEVRWEYLRGTRGPKAVGNAVLREMQLHSTRSMLPESDTTAVGLLPHDKGPVTAADS